ncbi:MAG: hypothetical protein AAFV74_22555 [Pseudomonadota bacterium]
MRFAICHAFLGLYFDNDDRMPPDLQEKGLRDFLSTTDNGGEAFARHLRVRHADRLALAETRTRLIDALADSRAVQFGQQQSPGDPSGFLADLINRETYGAYYAHNPLVEKVLFRPQSSQPLASLVAAMQDELARQRDVPAN